MKKVIISILFLTLLFFSVSCDKSDKQETSIKNYPAVSELTIKTMGKMSEMGKEYGKLFGY